MNLIKNISQRNSLFGWQLWNLTVFCVGLSDANSSKQSETRENIYNPAELWLVEEVAQFFLDKSENEEMQK